MNVFLDTNILISAVLNSNSTPAKAFIKAVSFPNRGLVCEQNIDEMRRIFNRKFPAKIQALETFLSLALLTLEMVNIPDLEYTSENSKKKWHIKKVSVVLRTAANHIAKD